MATSFPGIAALTAPLFLLVLVGYALSRFARWPSSVSESLNRFTFGIAIPSLLFRMMCDLRSLAPVDARLLVAYFGGGLVTFAIARLLAARALRMDGVSQTVFAMGTIFSNVVLLGLPLAKVALGDEALPSVSLVIVFNSLTLWTLATVSVEWARHRDLSAGGLTRIVRDVLTTPIIAAILAGTAYGFTGLPLPRFAAGTLDLLGEAAIPLSLVVLGMGLSEYGTREGMGPSLALSAMKLAVAPLVVWLIARGLALPLRETQAVVLLASLPVGANAYIMARQFGALEGPVATSLVTTTAISALTTPALLTLIA
ncbi:MAG: AEC family transporter [Burkholderiales bacterium]